MSFILWALSSSFLHEKEEPHIQQKGPVGVRQALERRQGDGSLCLSSLRACLFCLFTYTEQRAVGHPFVSCEVQMAHTLSCSPQGLRNLVHLAQGLSLANATLCASKIVEYTVGQSMGSVGLCIYPDRRPQNSFAPIIAQNCTLSYSQEAQNCYCFGTGDVVKTWPVGQPALHLTR